MTMVQCFIQRRRKGFESFALGQALGCADGFGGAS
jgi:hypothetical protein